MKGPQNKPSRAKAARSSGKRLCLPWWLSAERVAPAERVLFVRDANWVEENGRVRQGTNVRYTHQGRHSHWQWGNPTHWRPATAAQVRQHHALVDSWLRVTPPLNATSPHA